MSEENRTIVFYDGDCGFCNSAVQFILNHRKRDFYFVPLQSPYAQAKLKAQGITIKLDTLYLWKNGKIYDRSSAGLRISLGLKGLYPVLALFLIIPKFIRDWIYDGIAKRRHRIRKGFCAIPKPEEQQFFIVE